MDPQKLILINSRPRDNFSGKVEDLFIFALKMKLKQNSGHDLLCYVLWGKWRYENTKSVSNNV